MAGFIQILIYMLCVYFVFKGVEIFQIAFVGSGERRRAGLILGVAAIVASIVAAIVFAVWSERYGEEFNRRLQNTPSVFR
jgi:uncharacterized membrane protein (DUF485 family)